MNRYDLIILGCIADHELSGYDIIQFVKAKGLDSWAKIHVSTVYSRLSSLEKKDFIIGRSEKTSNRPERTLYSITPKGTELLSSEVTEHLTGFNDDPRTLGYAYLNQVPNQMAKETLNEHILYLESEKEKLDNLIQSMPTSKLYEEGPFLNCMSRDHIEVELKYAQAAYDILADAKKQKYLTNFFSINQE